MISRLSANYSQCEHENSKNSLLFFDLSKSNFIEGCCFFLILPGEVETSDAYLEPSRTSTMELSCENS